MRTDAEEKSLKSNELVSLRIIVKKSPCLSLAARLIFRGFIHLPCLFKPKNPDITLLVYLSFLFVVLVAEVALEGAQGITDGKIWALITADLVQVKYRVERQGRASVIGCATADGRAARDIDKLPFAEDPVDIEMMHEEDRVTGRSDGISHGGADTVVALSMEGKLNTTVEIRVARTGHADVVRIEASLSRDTLVHGTLDAVGVVDGLARSKVRLDTRESAIVNASTAAIGRAGKSAEILGGKDCSLGELSSPLLLIPPRHRPVESTLIPEHLLESPNEVAVPQEELVCLDLGALAVNIGCVHLMETDEILVSVL